MYLMFIYILFLFYPTQYLRHIVSLLVMIPILGNLVCTLLLEMPMIKRQCLFKSMQNANVSITLE